MTAADREQLDSLAIAQDVDVLCDRFEDALRQGSGGKLDDWLPVAGPARTAALIELAQLELEHRLRAGEAAHAEDYFVRFPQLRDNADAAERLRAAERRGSKAEPKTVAPAEPPTVELTPTRPVRPPGSGELRTLPLKFGRYRVVKVLGQGGMGTVYQCHDSQLDRPVAVKVMRFGDDPALVERFYREARIAAGLTHPQLCPVYDVGETGGLHYLTMPLLVGETLAAYLHREGPLPEKSAAQLTALLARAVHEAHQAGVLHRDLKPANVMLNERRQPIVMDFGLARRCGPLDPRTTAAGTLLGTPAYMAPEQITCGSDAGGPAQDVYSLGVMLYEMLTGRLPFEGSLQEILTQTLTQPPPVPSQYRVGLDRRLERVCLTALAKDPQARYISMEAFAEALEECEQTAAPSSRQWRPWLAIGLVVAAVLILAIAAAVWMAFGFLFGRGGRGTETASQPSVPAVTATNLFEVGSDWRGKFRWKGDDSYDGRVKVEVLERRGEFFKGRYTADGGDYVWRIEGFVRGTNVEWRFTEVVHEKDEKHVVGIATVEGRIEGAELKADFAGEDSRAVMTLQRWK